MPLTWGRRKSEPSEAQLVTDFSALVAEVAFSEWTHDGHVRQPSYKGLREDKAATEVRHERAAADLIRAGKRELKLSNLDKPFWPEEGITKRRLLEYYAAISGVLSVLESTIMTSASGAYFFMSSITGATARSSFFVIMTTLSLPFTSWPRRDIPAYHPPTRC